MLVRLIDEPPAIIYKGVRYVDWSTKPYGSQIPNVAVFSQSTTAKTKRTESQQKNHGVWIEMPPPCFGSGAFQQTCCHKLGENKKPTNANTYTTEGQRLMHYFLSPLTFAGLKNILNSSTYPSWNWRWTPGRKGRKDRLPSDFQAFSRDRNGCHVSCTVECSTCTTHLKTKLPYILRYLDLRFASSVLGFQV